MAFFPASNGSATHKLVSKLPRGIITAMSVKKYWVFGNRRGKRDMWGLFAGEARKQPPHMAPTTADPRETKYFRRPAFLILVILPLAWTACSQAPIEESPAPTAPSYVTPYRTRTPGQDASPPARPARTPTPLPTPTPTPVTHRVIKGETMLGIALRYGISLEELMAANPEVDPRFLSVDTELVIPLGENSPAALEMPTPVPVSLGELTCYPTGDGGAWCFWPVYNQRSRSLENLSARIILYSSDGDALAESSAIPPLNLIPGEQSLPLVAFFPPPLPDEFFPQGELLTALPVRPKDERYLEAKLDVEEVALDPSGLQATLRGWVSLPRNSAPASLVWLAAVAYGEDGRVVGVRKWEAVVARQGTPTVQPAGSTPIATPSPVAQTPAPGTTEQATREVTSQSTENESILHMQRPLEAGESLPFELTVFSLGPPIQEVEVLVEARP